MPHRRACLSNNEMCLTSNTYNPPFLFSNEKLNKSVSPVYWSSI